MANGHDAEHTIIVEAADLINLIRGKTASGRNMKWSNETYDIKLGDVI